MWTLLLSAVFLWLPQLALINESRAQKLSGDAIENASVHEPKAGQYSPHIIKAQVLLDLARFSPGVIDGNAGENTRLAIKAFQLASDLDPTGNLDQKTWEALLRTRAGAILQEYTITKSDVAGPFRKLPAKMEAQAKLKKLGFSSPRELLAEKFHMHEELLTALNPGKSLEKAGTTITVVETRSGKLGDVARVQVHKTEKAVRAYDGNGRLLAHFPATVGSESRPAPTGTFKVTRIAKNPTYTYRPENRIRGVSADKPFEVAPGPNNPVGTIWIEIDKESYGLHGTPEPTLIGKTSSHGCVRLTNWDAEDLAAGLRSGVPVEFTGS